MGGRCRVVILLLSADVSLLQFLQNGECVNECTGDGGSTGLENQDGRECN